MTANTFTRALGDAHGSAAMVNELQTNIIKWIDRSKVKEFQDLALIGSPVMKQMCVGERYDETKPRIKRDDLSARISISSEKMRLDGNVILSTLDELGAFIGSQVNHNCGSCQYASPTLQASYQEFSDATIVTARLRCGLPGNMSVCPDMHNLRMAATSGNASTAGAKPPSLISFDKYMDEYQGNFNNYNPLFTPNKGNPFATDFSMDMGSVRNGEYLREGFQSVKLKETVKDADIEVEILKLDKRYGMF